MRGFSCAQANCVKRAYLNPWVRCDGLGGGERIGDLGRLGVVEEFAGVGGFSDGGEIVEICSMLRLYSYVG